MAVLELMIGYQIQLWVYFGYSSSLTQTQMSCYMSEEFVKRCVRCTSINAFIKNMWIKMFVEIPQPGIIQVVELHLPDAFIQSNLQCIQVIHFLSLHVFPGNRTYNLCAANAML